MAGTIRIAEDEFKLIDTRTIDERRRLTLGSLVSGSKRVRVSINDRGDILLQPVVEIPASEAWLFHNREALESVKRGLRDAAHGRVSKLNSTDL